MSGQHFWWLQSFSCICLYMLTIVTDVLELIQMRCIQGRSSDTFLSMLLFTVLLNTGIPRQLGAPWPPKTSKREQGNTGVFQHICDYLQSHQLPEPECWLYNTSDALPYPRQREKKLWIFNIYILWQNVELPSHKKPSSLNSLQLLYYLAILHVYEPGEPREHKDQI